MARSDQLRTEIARLESKVADLQKAQTKAQKTADDAAAAARKKRDQAGRTKSDSTRRTSLTTAERKEKEATTASNKVSDLARKVAESNKSIGTKRASLRSAESSEQRVLDREAERRRTKEKNHVREVSRLSRPPAQIRYVEVQPPKPEPLRVLYLTANPHSIETVVEHPDGEVETRGVWLRVDQEVRQVKQALRAANFRDQISVEHLPAATGDDLIDGLNNYRPHVVHFSGHASSWGLQMEDAEGSQEGSGVEFSLLARILGATDDPPRLIVLNACESLDGADALLQTVPTVIGMSESITDLAAVTFAAQFYSGIASAQSVATAVEQAKTKMQLAALEDSELPQIRTRDDVDAKKLILVEATV